MKKIILFLSFSIIFFINSGVSENTIIQTINGLEEIGSLQQGDTVICFDDQLKEHLSSIENIESKTFNNIIEIITYDDVTIRVAPEQKFFSFYKWINAEDLSLNDFLFTKNKSWIRIKSIRHIQEEKTFYFIEVKDHHNFLITENGILVHNGANGAVIGAWIGRGLAYTGGMIAAGIIALPAAAAGPWAYSVACASVAGTIAPKIEAAAKVSSIAGGIIGGVLTGPA